MRTVCLYTPELLSRYFFQCAVRYKYCYIVICAFSVLIILCCMPSVLFQCSIFCAACHLCFFSAQYSMLHVICAFSVLTILFCMPSVLFLRSIFDAACHLCFFCAQYSVLHAICVSSVLNILCCMPSVFFQCSIFCAACHLCFSVFCILFMSSKLFLCSIFCAACHLCFFSAHYYVLHAICAFSVLNILCCMPSVLFQCSTFCAACHLCFFCAHFSYFCSLLYSISYAFFFLIQLYVNYLTHYHTMPYFDLL